VRRRDSEDIPYAYYFKAFGFPTPDMEVRFHGQRRWRMDFVFPGKVAVEVDGLFGAHGHVGGHRSVSGKLNDNEKSNEAQILGYMVLRFTPREIRSGQFVDTLTRALQERAKVGQRPPKEKGA